MRQHTQAAGERASDPRRARSSRGTHNPLAHRLTNHSPLARRRLADHDPLAHRLADQSTCVLRCCPYLRSPGGEPHDPCGASISRAKSTRCRAVDGRSRRAYESCGHAICAGVCRGTAMHPPRSDCRARSAVWGDDVDSADFLRNGIAGEGVCSVRACVCADRWRYAPFEGRVRVVVWIK